MKSKNIADAIDMLDDDILLHTAEVRMKIKKLKRVKTSFPRLYIVFTLFNV